MGHWNTISTPFQNTIYHLCICTSQGAQRFHKTQLGEMVDLSLYATSSFLSSLWLSLHLEICA